MSSLGASLLFALTCCLICASHTFAQKGASKRKVAPRSVVLTTDIGAEMDDQWTLAHLAVAPEINLRGIVTTHAPSLTAPAAESAARVAQEVLQNIPGAPRVSIIAGSSLPLTSQNTPRPNKGVEFLIAESRRFHARHRLAVLVTGAATDVASALLSDSTFADRIEIIAMGFDDHLTGGDSWNVKNDINAWRVLLASHAPLTIGDANVTKRDLMMTRQHARKLFAAYGATGDYLVGLLDNWIERDPAFAVRVTGRTDTWVIWDQVVVAHLLSQTRTVVIKRPTLRDDLSFDYSRAGNSKRTAKWVTAVDKAKLWRHFAACIADTEKNQRAIHSEKAN